MEHKTFYDKLNYIWEKSNSLVCVGLDPDAAQLPQCVKSAKYPIFEFNKAIIDATHDLVCSYKPQIAYYAAAGVEDQLEMTINYIHTQYPEILVILDAKRGDIGSTADMYAHEAFDRYRADALTVNPFMGADTMKPYLDRAEKGVIILCKTSNPGSSLMQDMIIEGIPLYLRIAKLAQEEWNQNNNVMLVVGATYPEELKQVRELAPDIPFLVPGVGAQGGNAKDVLLQGQNSRGTGLMINSSRGIIYASTGDDFASAARIKTIELKEEINQFRKKSAN